MNKLSAAKKAADELFADTTVGVAETRENLEELIEHIQSMLETLDPKES